jgi:hypothetical protein
MSTEPKLSLSLYLRWPLQESILKISLSPLHILTSKEILTKYIKMQRIIILYQQHSQSMETTSILQNFFSGLNYIKLLLKLFLWQLSYNFLKLFLGTHHFLLEDLFLLLVFLMSFSFFLDDTFDIIHQTFFVPKDKRAAYWLVILSVDFLISLKYI